MTRWRNRGIGERREDGYMMSCIKSPNEKKAELIESLKERGRNHSKREVGGEGPRSFNV